MAMNGQCGCTETGPDFCCKCADIKDGYYGPEIDNDDLESYADALKKENNALRKNNEELTLKNQQLEETLKRLRLNLVNTTGLYHYYKDLHENGESEDYSLLDQEEV